MTPARQGISQRRRLQLLGLTAAASQLLIGCVQAPQRPTDASQQYWSGRLALHIEAEPAQSFNAGFELTGSAQAGMLTLHSPLGNTLAELRCTAHHAQLSNGTEQRQAGTLEQLLRELTGTDIPVQALFAWLQGQDMPAAGWQADLSRLAEGRLLATRHSPAPPATLRLILER